MAGPCDSDLLGMKECGAHQINFAGNSFAPPESTLLTRTTEGFVLVTKSHCFRRLVMESPFAATAPYIPSQPLDRFHASSSNGLNPPSETSLVSPGFTAEATNYNITQPHSLSTSQFHVPRFGNFHFGYGDPFAPAPLVPTTAPTSGPLYDSLSILGFHPPDLNFSEPQPFPLSQPPISPPATMPTYQINDTLGPVPSRFPYIRPMPAEGLGGNSSIALPHRPKIPIELAARTSSREAQPANVVGTQGRRGPLPSASGRPAAVAGEMAMGPKSANIPVKDANGKYACQYCVKVYLHAKHLKRHLLRRKCSDAGKLGR